MVITTSGIVRHGGGDQLSLIELSKDYERPPSAMLSVTGLLRLVIDAPRREWNQWKIAVFQRPLIACRRCVQVLVNVPDMASTSCPGSSISIPGHRNTQWPGRSYHPGRTPRQIGTSPQSLAVHGMLRRTALPAPSPPSTWHIKLVHLAGSPGPSKLARLAIVRVWVWRVASVGKDR